MRAGLLFLILGKFRKSTWIWKICYTKEAMGFFSGNNDLKLTGRNGSMGRSMRYRTGSASSEKRRYRGLTRQSFGFSDREKHYDSCDPDLLANGKKLSEQKELDRKSRQKNLKRLLKSNHDALAEVLLVDTFYDRQHGGCGGGCFKRSRSRSSVFSDCLYRYRERRRNAGNRSDRRKAWQEKTGSV